VDSLVLEKNEWDKGKKELGTTKANSPSAFDKDDVRERIIEKITN
jgi:hypothetical protein